MTLLGISQGAATCIHYALRHPERVARLILYGGYAHGALQARDAGRAGWRISAMIELARVAWGSDNPTFRQVFTSRFIPGGTHEQLRVVQRSLPEDHLRRDRRARCSRRAAHIDIAELLADVRAPTLVLHARDDEVVPIAEGRLLASGIPGAEFVELDSRNHILLEHEPAWQRFCEAVLAFMQQPAQHGRRLGVRGAVGARARGAGADRRRA